MGRSISDYTGVEGDHGRSGPMCAVVNDGDVRWNAEGNIDSSWAGEWRAVCESPAYLEKMRCNPTTLMPSTRAACEQAAQNMGYDFKDLVNTEPEPPVNCAKCAVLNISPGYTTVQWNPDGKPDSTCGGPWYAVCVAPPPTHVNIEFFSNTECAGEPTLTSQVRSDGTCVEAPSDVHSIYTTDYTHWGVSTLDSYTYRSCSDSSQGECDNQFETTRTRCAENDFGTCLQATPEVYYHVVGTTASPPPPPPPLAPTTHTVEVTFSAAGEPGDYDAAARSKILDVLATAAGLLSSAGATLTVEAGSVIFTATFPFTSAERAQTATNALATSLPDQEALQAALTNGGVAIQVTSSATLKSSGDDSSAEADSDSTGLILGAVGGGVALLVALVAIVVCRMRSASKTPAKALPTNSDRTPVQQAVPMGHAVSMAAMDTPLDVVAQPPDVIAQGVMVQVPPKVAPRTPPKARGNQFDPMTGKPLPKFDPYTGVQNWFDDPKARGNKFDPMTGKPLPKFDPRTGVQNWFDDP